MLTGEATGLVANAHKYSLPVTIDMSLTCLTLAIADEDPIEQLIIDVDTMSMGLHDLLSFIKERRAKRVPSYETSFNDNTVALACVLATQRRQGSGDSISKREDTQCVFA